MLNQIKKIIKPQSKPKEVAFTYEQLNLNPKFQLKYQEHIIGYLDFKGNEWEFYYTDWFKEQNELNPLFEFPLKDQIYKCSSLWPFFESRIPSLKQPKLQEYLEANPEDKNNKVKLLQTFGFSSINNPYKLILV